ncbi:MAG: VWA domain-containing protein, partial [Myxococcales bacterium]|nr:VWA domain-containing protein [Myxococcales bacterium]
ERAAVDDYRLQIGALEVRGVMQTLDDARQTYADAKSKGHTAGLLEQQRPNIFTQHVANIPPGESVEVAMHVVQPLAQDHGVYKLVLPTVVGPRYIPGRPNGRGGTDVVPDAAKVTAPMIPEGFTSCASVEVSVAIESGLRPRALRSSFHAIDIERQKDVAFVTLDSKAGPIPADRDFILSWDLGQADPRAAIVAQPDADGEGGYFTLTVQPPETVADADALPRELVFVVDNSGSMSGIPIDTAKALMQRALSGLRDDDLFTVLRFSESASGLSETMLPATAANIAAGRDYVTAMEGMGGTEMTEGIRAALSLPHEPDRMRIVMFLTDGYIGNEDQIFSLIESEVRDTRLFSLGVGYAPNRYLLDGMAMVGRGAATYAGEEEAIDSVVDHFYERVETPVLGDLEIDWQGLDVTDVYPARLPDLFAGQPLTVYGRYEGAPSGSIVVRGQARGQAVEVPVDFDVAAAENVAGVSSMWAHSKIDGLLGYPNRAGSAEITQQVVETALAYRIMTEYTAFVAVADRVVELERPALVIEEALPLPLGTHPGGSSGVLGVGTVSGVAYGVGSGSDSGDGSGGGVGSGYGAGGGAGFSGRGRRVPQIRSARAQVQGSLDKDIIRRIVRAHINEV